MKKIFLITLVSLFALCGSAYAQNVMVVNSETVFRSIDEYNTALSSIERMAESYQKSIDEDFAAIERLYNSYQSQRAYMTETARVAQENAILAKEDAALARQESIFGNEGELMQKRIELIRPIQQRVFGVIESYAKRNHYTVVLDSASNPTILFTDSSADKTQEIINLLK